MILEERASDMNDPSGKKSLCGIIRSLWPQPRLNLVSRLKHNLSSAFLRGRFPGSGGEVEAFPAFVSLSLVGIRFKEFALWSTSLLLRNLDGVPGAL